MKKPLRLLIFICSFALTVYFLILKWQLGQTRYFDVDEFAYLHWAWSIASGKRIYIDFFNYVAPGFTVLLSGLYKLGLIGITPVLVTRGLMTFIFIGLLVGTSVLFWLTRHSFWVVAVALIFAFLPLPADKFIEIRPDGLALLIGLIGVIGQICWWRSGKARWAVVSGVSYVLSVVVLQKMLPWAAFAVMLNLVQDDWKKNIFKNWPWIVGIGITSLLLIAYLLSLGNPSLVWYSLVTLPLESNKIGQIFIMMPDLFFYPNIIFYGVDGVNLGLVINHIFWVVGGLIGLYRFFTPFLRGKEFAREEILISGLFILHAFLYVAIYPLKHTQYLMPLSLFIAYYVADGLCMIWESISRGDRGETGNKGRIKMGQISFVSVFSVLLIFLFTAYRQVNTPKLTWTNQKSLTQMKKIFTTIPPGTPVFDLVGATIYFPDAYFACCIPFGQMLPYMSRPLPSIIDSLEKGQVKYIYEGEVKRIGTLPTDVQSYIRTHYQPHAEVENLLIRK